MLGRPVPTVAPSRPFHRNSTLGDIESTKVGRVIASQIVREGLKRSAQEFPDPDEATLKMVERALKEGPVRALVLLSGGLVTFPMVDSALDALNGDWSDVAGRVRRLGSDRLSGSRPRGGTGS
jgi:beta-glucosidase